jgi:radical SAM superfamily enzyme YgiQ (UPF0313 family)
MIQPSRPFRLTIIHPCVGRRAGDRKYLKTWQMEPLPAAMIAALTPGDVEKRFYDDRFEFIPFDEPTDLVAISIETYTARRAYQIASEYRRRGVPVVMGGYHATLCPDEVAIYADSVVVGEAEETFPKLLDDYRHGTPEVFYRANGQPKLSVDPDRSIFANKTYLPIQLVEFARGCRFRCEFCAIQSFHKGSHNFRDVDRVIREIGRVRKPNQMVFFIDDNLTSGMSEAKELLKALIPLKLKWFTQTAINVTHDDEMLDLMKRAGCQGVLVGFESLNAESLKQMNKGFNLMKGGPAVAIQNLKRHGLVVYGTFIVGYDHDTPESIAETVAFAKQQGLFIAAFNHITPFPGTPLYKRLEQEGKLLFQSWWTDPRYRYNMIPFKPANMSPRELEDLCLQARKEFYSWRSIASRARQPVNRSSLYVLRNYVFINAIHQWDIEKRSGMPLGDEGDQSELVAVYR